MCVCVVLFVCLLSLFVTLVPETSHNKAEWTKTLQARWRASLFPKHKSTLAQPSEVRLVMNWRFGLAPSSGGGVGVLRSWNTHVLETCTHFPASTHWESGDVGQKSRTSNHFRRSLFYCKEKNATKTEKRRMAAEQNPGQVAQCFSGTLPERQGLTRTWTDWRG